MIPHGFHLLNCFFIFYCSLFRHFFKRVIYHGSLLFLHLRCSKYLGGFKASDRHEQGHIIPIQMIALSFLVTLGRWKWFDMETRLTCSIFAMLSGGLIRTLGSCFSEGIGRFHFPSVALVSLDLQVSANFYHRYHFLLEAFFDLLPFLKPEVTPKFYGISFVYLKL